MKPFEEADKPDTVAPGTTQTASSDESPAAPSPERFPRDAHRDVEPKGNRVGSSAKLRDQVSTPTPPCHCANTTTDGQLGTATRGFRTATYYALQIDTFDREAEPIVERLSRHHGIVVDSTEGHLVPPGYYNVYYDEAVCIADDNWVLEFALRRGCKE